MEKKSNGLLVGIIIGLVIALVIGGCLLATGNISFKTNTTNNKQTSEKKDINNQESTNTNKEDNNINEVSFNDEKISISNISQESIHISSAGIESVNPIYDYYVDLYSSGKVSVETIGMGNQNNNVRNKEFISNVDNVVDIIQFNIAGIPEEQLIYMLLDNGDVYYYKVGDSINKKYIATKVENVSNVKKLFIYHYPAKKNAGGSWSIVAIKENNETIALNTDSV